MLPNQCEQCGLAFEDTNDFLGKTEPIEQEQSLMEATDSQDLHLIEIWRRCPCGTTLLMLCPDRRRKSPEVQHHRQAFDRLAQRLEERGFERDAARRYLKNLLVL